MMSRRPSISILEESGVAHSDWADDFSPYRPPPTVEEDEVKNLPPPAPGGEPKLNLAAVQIVFSLGAGAAGIASMAVTPASLLIAPPIFFLLYVLYWISEYCPQPAEGTQTPEWKARKVSAVLYLPFLSMVFFVPAYTTGALLLTNFFRAALEESLLIFLPLCGAYYVTVLVLTRLLQGHLSREAE